MVVTSVNDAPTITNGYTHTLTSTNEDTNSSGTLASAILTGASWADIDTGAVSGLAITGVTGNGTWQYSTDGTTWNNFGAVTSTNALLITSSTQVRYQPNGQNGETATFTYRAWDQTSGTASTNSTANYATTASSGGTTAFSSNTATASMVVTSLNDAPVLDNSGDMTLNPITEDDTSNSGQSVASIIASASGDRITDVDSGAIEGIAITASTNGNGYWEYSTDNGTTWTTVGAVSDGSALLLRNTDWLRFVPDGQNATTGDITFRAWDQTSGTVGTKVDASVHGGTTAFSTATEVASITVAAVNDAPIANIDTATAVEAGGTNNGTAGTSPSGSVLTNDTDVDAGDTKTVTGVMAGVQALATGPVLSPVNGAFGSITIAADGSYTYTVDNTNAAVQALRTSANTLQDVFTYTMRDTAGSISTSQITITIQGSNDAPVAVVDTAIAVEAGGTNNGTTGTNPTGNVLANDTDPDSVANGETQTVTGVAAGVHALASGSVATSINGNYGSIVLNADGTYSYTVNNNHAAIQALNAGDTLSDVFTYTVTDTAGATSSNQVTITIHGTNDAPVASSIETSAVAYVENDGARTITSTLALADVDNASLSSAVIQITGNYIHGEDLLSFANQNGISGSWDANTGRLTLTGTATKAQYEAALRSVRYTNLSDEPNTATRTVSFTANDGNLSSNTQTRDIAIASVNDAPVISVDAGDSDSSVLNETNTSLSSGGTLSALDLDPSDVVTAQVTSVTSGGVTTGLLSNNTALLNMLSVNANVISSGNTTGTILWTFNSGSEAFNYLAAGETLTLTYTITATDSQFASDTQQVTITITGTNDDPIVTIGGGDSAAETLGVTGSTLTTGGSLSVADIDRTDVVTAAVSNFVKSGDLTGLTLNDSQLQAMLGLNANVISNTQQSGTINWNFDSAGYTFGYLAAGQSITLTYTITVTDSQGATDTQDVVVTISGANSAPDITVQPGDSASGSLTESNSTLSSGGTLSVLDINTTDTVTAQVSSVTATGTTTGLLSNNAALLNMLSINSNVIGNTTETGTITWAFNSASEAFNYLAAGETLTLTYTITATDSQNASDTQQVTITITGTNDAPIVTIGGGDSAAETLGVTGSTLTTGGSLSVADIDRTDVVTAAVSNFVKSGDLTGLALSDSQLQAMLGLNANVISNTQQSGNINWNFNSNGYTFGYLAAGQSITLTYTVTVTDSQGATDTRDVVVTINGANSAPDITVQPGDSASSSLTETNSTLSSNGTLSVLDINTTDTVTAQASSVTASGTTTGLLSNNAALLNMLSINSNVISNTTETGTITWNFDSASEAFNYLAAGETLTLTYTITATDSQNASDTQQVTITITGTNDDPIVTIGGGDSAAETLGSLVQR